MTRYQQLFGAGPALLLLAIGLSAAAVEVQKVTGFPQPNLSLPVRLGLAGGILASGGGLILWSFSALPFNERGRKVVTTGPFRFVRHPLYTGVFCSSGLMVCLLAQTLLGLVAVALMFFGGHILVRREEAYMEAQFGEEWVSYAQKTPRFFPRLKRKRNE